MKAMSRMAEEASGRGWPPARGGAWGALVVLCAAMIGAWGGCTAESLRVALETQRRADQVQQAVSDAQHEALRILLYRDLLARLEGAGPGLSDEQRAAVGQAWNERDLLEFWAVQEERGRALRLAGVDAKLAGDQSVVDLLIKALERRVDRVTEAVAERAGAAAAATGERTGASGDGAAAP
jgi:hypothetical protein